jgi:hypothetical protein
VIVGPSPSSLNEFLPDPTNPATLISAQCRPTVAYVGAGDGMIHAIFLQGPPAKDAFGNLCPGQSACGYHAGQEMWAFMPNQELPLVHTGGNCVRSLFVDGVPVVKDVYANFTTNPANAPTWHTVLTDTMGQGGNHVFALDVTDPFAPLRAGASPSTGSCAANVTSLGLSTVPVVLWEQGDPLDPNDPKPFIDTTSGSYAWQGPSGTEPFQDTTAEGPGFTPTIALGTAPNYHHYLGQSSTVFMGSLAGSGPAQSITYVAGQNSPVSGYGTLVNLQSCASSCNPKDFAANGGAGDTSTAHGATGEVVYAFDSATGIAQTIQTAAGANVLEHFSLLYSRNASRSNGFNDIPAPVLGMSTSGRPETDIILVPDLDGQIWALRPATLTSVESYGSPASPFPMFDIQRYGGAQGPRFSCNAGSGATAHPALLDQAAFANPGAVLLPGTCSASASNGASDPVAVFASGGVDWGPQASIISLIDVAVDDLQQLPAGPAAAVANDGWAELLPLENGAAAGACVGIEVATCQNAVAGCIGRVFGQPLVEGGSIFFTTDTGVLTGSGASLDQQNGDGTISTLGAAGCSGTTCSVCQATEQSVDLESKVGKVASGLAAVSAGTNKVEVFSASTTGLNDVISNIQASATKLYQKLVLQQWWMRPQRPSACDPNGISTCN